MIESWHVREALRPRFGSALVDVPGIWDRAAAMLLIRIRLPIWLPVWRM